MGIMDKIQGAAEKITGDDTRLNAAEMVAVQQAYHALQIGYIKTEFYIQGVTNAELKAALQEMRDDFIKVHIDKPRRILEKAGVPFLNLNVESRIQNRPATGQVFRDEEVILDSILAFQATVSGMQAGALVAVRGDVRDYFLTARDSAMDQWKKFGIVVVRTTPQVMPPTFAPGTGMPPSTPANR